jgi:hypothetical protein
LAGIPNLDIASAHRPVELAGILGNRVLVSSHNREDDFSGVGLNEWCDGRIKSMIKKTISAGAVHSVPADLRKVLTADPAARAKWEDITPLARNEWICWVISVKKPETRRQHIERVRTELKEGMRRPCCWPGCPHR